MHIRNRCCFIGDKSKAWDNSLTLRKWIDLSLKQFLISLTNTFSSVLHGVITTFTSVRQTRKKVVDWLMSHNRLFAAVVWPNRCEVTGIELKSNRRCSKCWVGFKDWMTNDLSGHLCVRRNLKQVTLITWLLMVHFLYTVPVDFTSHSGFYASFFFTVVASLQMT